MLGRFATKTLSLELHRSTLTIEVPLDIDEVIDRSMTTGLDPYWGELWDAAITMAEMILGQPEIFQRPGETVPAYAMETGCGIGLVGLAALIAFRGRVDFSDMVPEAVALAVRNARTNGFSCEGRVIDWGTCDHEETPSYDAIFASDVLYDRRGHVSLLEFAKRMLSPRGTLWLGDPGRTQSPQFLELAQHQGWECEIRDQLGRSRPRWVEGEFQLLSCRRDFP